MRCPHCHREGYEPRDTFASAEGFFRDTGDTRRWRFVKTGEFRAPKAGEWYLSGAMPMAYRTRLGLDTPYIILRHVPSDEVSHDSRSD